MDNAQNIPEEKRIFFIDNLRILLTVLVIMIHVAATYGAAVLWYYYERKSDILSNLLLNLFVFITQFFALDFFFLISGYFVPAALGRKGTKSFLKERFLRLGIPLIIYLFIINPILVYILLVKFKIIDTSIKSWIAPGPLWYVGALLFFSLIYTLCRSFKDKSSYHQPQKEKNFPQQSQILLYIVILALATFFVRIWFPVGNVIWGISLAFFPSYFIWFIVGTIAYQNKWLEKFPNSSYKRWLILAIIIILLLPLLIAVETILTRQPSKFFGGWHWQSFLFSLSQAIISVAIILSLLTLFRKRFNRQEKLARIITKNTYTVYIIHAPVIVFLSYYLRNIALIPILKFFLVSLIGIPLCFLISHYLIRKIPGLNKIL